MNMVLTWDLFLWRLAELGISLLVAVAALFLAIKVFDRLTHNLDEWAELRKGNMAVAIFLSVMVLSIALMVTLLFG